MLTALSRFDSDTIKVGSSLHIRHRHPVFTAFRYFYLLLIPLGALLIFLGEQTFGILCLLLGPVLFLRKTFFQFRLIKSAKPDPRRELHWTFTKDGFIHKSGSYQKTFSWQDLHDGHLSPKAILLYLDRDNYFILPQNAFQNPADFQATTRLVQHNLPSSEN